MTNLRQARCIAWIALAMSIGMNSAFLQSSRKPSIVNSGATRQARVSGTLVTDTETPCIPSVLNHGARQMTASDTAVTDTETPPSLSTLDNGAIEEESSTRLRKIQALASPVAKSFAPSTFNPHPLLKNCHLQTIGGVFLRSDPNCAYLTGGLGSIVKSVVSAATSERSESYCTYWDERERIDTPDGDFFHVDYKFCSHRIDARGTLIFLHGLESNSNSSLSIEIAKAHHNLGFNVACLNFRGCSGVPNEKMGMYHAGHTTDLRHFLGIVKERYPTHPLYLSGFSLGANAVIKALGELGEAASSIYNIQGAAVTGAPFDMERNSKFVDAPGFNRIVYAGNFLKTMKQKCREKLEEYCDNDPDTHLFDFKGVMAAETIAEVENCWLAPVHGFESYIDYYRKVSSTYFLDGIAVPTFILNAGDDPFFDPSYFPIEKGVDGRGAAPIKMVRTEHGGHLGFLFHRPKAIDLNDSAPKPSVSWMPTELARFIDHVDTQPPNPN